MRKHEFTKCVYCGSTERQDKFKNNYSYCSHPCYRFGRSLPLARAWDEYPHKKSGSWVAQTAHPRVRGHVGHCACGWSTYVQAEPVDAMRSLQAHWQENPYEPPQPSLRQLT